MEKKPPRRPSTKDRLRGRPRRLAKPGEKKKKLFGLLYYKSALCFFGQPPLVPKATFPLARWYLQPLPPLCHVLWKACLAKLYVDVNNSLCVPPSCILPHGLCVMYFLPPRHNAVYEQALALHGEGSPHSDAWARAKKLYDTVISDE